MAKYDVFNGDADGLCALQQLRLASPEPNAQLITGVKRDISLLKKVKASAADRITVLDISLDKNIDPLQSLLDAGASVEYFDHHFPGERIPRHENFIAHIDTQSDTCTSLIVNAYLNSQHWLWAATGAFGDNFDQSAMNLITAQNVRLRESEISLLRNLGTYINYNAYGESVSDLHIPPAALFRALHPYANPLNFITGDSAYQKLEHGYQEDMSKAASLTAEFETAQHALFVLPAEPWARRVSGVYANDLAQNHPQRAHALLTQLISGGYLVSVRAPLSTKSGADDLCRLFASGGGRKAAAGINLLPEADLHRFIAAFRAAYP